MKNKKRKIAILMSMIVLLSVTPTNTASAEEEVMPISASIENLEEIENAAEINSIMEISMDGAVKLAVENSREMWKIDDGLGQVKEARKQGKNAKDQAELLIGMSLDEISGIKSITGVDPLNNYVDTLLAKNGYYITYADTQTKELEKNRELLLKGIEIETKSLYYSVLVAEKAIEINEAKLNKANEQLRVINLKFDNGTATKAEVLNGELAVVQAQTDLDSANDDLEMAKLNLLNKLDLPFDTKIILTDKELTYVPIQEIDLSASIEKAKAERPEILSALNKLELQKIETHAYTAYYTSNLRQHKSAEEKLKDAELNVPQSYKDVELDVRKAYLNLVKAERALLNMDKTLELSREAARINKLLFENGMAASLDVLEADTNLAQAEIGHYQLLVSYNISKLMFDNSNLIGTMK